MTKIVCSNKKALFDYHIEESFEAGVSLLGTEVKSLRDGGGSLLDSHVATDARGVFLFNFRISPYRYSPIDKKHDPLRKKYLLLHKSQIDKIFGKAKQKGFTAVPIKAYFNKNNILKIEIAIVKGKKLHDKRESIRERDRKIEAKREMSGSSGYDN